MTPGVVDRAEDATPAWLSAALGRPVESVRSTRIGTGQMGTTYRLELVYGPEGGPGPARLVMKVASDDEAMRRKVAGGYASEVGFYQNLAPSLSVATPRCWYAGITDDNSRFTLLLDDVSPAAAGVQTAGCTHGEAVSAISNLIGLHAPLWADPALGALDFLQQPTAARAEWTAKLAGAAAEAFLDRFESAVADPALLREAAAAVSVWMEGEARRPLGVIHGDYRMDNLLFHPSDGAVWAVDWQTASRGQPLRDVAYFLGTCADTGDRRAWEERLVGGYHSALVGAGVTGYPADQCWADYRRGHLQGPMVGLIGYMYASGPRTGYSDAMFVTMIQRSCAAIGDLGSLDAL